VDRERVIERDTSRLAAYRVLTTDPPIIYMIHWMNRDLVRRLLHPIYSTLRDRRAYFLVRWTWNVAPRERASLIRQWEAKHSRQYPLHRFIHLAKNTDEVEALSAVDLCAIFCNTNSLLDERLYRPLALAGVTPHYDAVYDARLMPYKRHDLAREVERLALVYASDWVGKSDYDQVRSLLPHAHFVNHHPGPGYRPLQPHEVNTVLNMSSVGLCLSHEEGGMYASTQYLLSGLPIVTTDSLGGRDVFFDPEFVITVPPDPEEVARAVHQLSTAGLDRQHIRSKTLRIVAEHRRRFVRLVEQILAREGRGRDFSPEWRRLFSSKVLRWEEAANGARLLQESTGPG
jgi:glycosyltransferase involved in cell wall biosynthesis